MRFAIFSDIHANLQAWEAVLADIQTQGVDTLVCLGDVVGYGPMPGPVLESVYQHTDNFVLGNHDAVVGGRIGAATFNQHARYVIEWTAAQLGEEGAAFFAQVPLTLRGENLFFTHGDAARPGHFDYVVKAEDARSSFQACKDGVIFFGHTHDPCVFACANNKGIIDKLPGSDVVLSKGRRYMINPGSVGDPRCASDLRGSYCLYDDTTRRVSFRKVEFDTEAYRLDLQASGLEMMPYFLRVIDAGSRRPEEDDELAIVQDHREEVEVDESMTVQPRELVTVASPMANRPKLHFGYPQAPRQNYPGAYPVPVANPMQMRGYRPGQPQTRQIGYHVPVAPPRQRNGLAIVIVGILIGLIGVIIVIGRLAGSSDTDRVKLSSAPTGAASPEITDGEGWDDLQAEEDQEPEVEAPSLAVVGPAPVFSLSALEERPFERYAVELPVGVSLVDTEFGGPALKFGAGSDGLEIHGGDELDFGGAISIAAWVRIGRETHERTIFARAGADGTSPMSLTVTSSKHRYPGCVIFGGAGLEPSSVRSSSKKPIDDGRWHFVMGMHDEKEGKLRVYVDGVISKSANATGTFPVCTGPMSVGAGDFCGEIYGLRIYDWPLHTTEMLKVYEGGR